jgi:hypothetical protein
MQENTFYAREHSNTRGRNLTLNPKLLNPKLLNPKLLNPKLPNPKPQTRAMHASGKKVTHGQPPEPWTPNSRNACQWQHTGSPASGVTQSLLAADTLGTH